MQRFSKIIQNEKGEGKRGEGGRLFHPKSSYAVRGGVL
jgi:hypothetical protein